MEFNNTEELRADGFEVFNTDAINTWNESLTPRTPISAPSVDKDPSKWGGHTPQWTDWINGAKVRYAVLYANSAGTGARSDSTHYGTRSKGACV